MIREIPADCKPDLSAFAGCKLTAAAKCGIAPVFLSVFIIWGFIAIVNQIKTEFGQEPYPVSWFLFTLSLVAVLFGFNDYGSDNPLVRYVGTLSAFFAVLAVTYLTLCGESTASSPRSSSLTGRVKLVCTLPSFIVSP